MATTHSLWQSVLGEIEVSISSAAFSTWLKNTEMIDDNEDNVVIQVTNIFTKSQIESKYDKLIRQALKNNGIDAKKISYVVDMQGKKTVVNRETTRQPAATPRPEEFAHLPSRSSGTPAANTLNPRYTFDNFIVGSNNDLAYTACRTVAAAPGTKYNPMFLYGGVGLGKTHLMQAVGNEIKANNPDANVVYINTETFVKEFTDAIRLKKRVSDKYRSADVLIVDDMQFIAGKEKTQEEFFHTFNALHQANKQIIISSDKPAKSIPTLTERLQSRLEWGMSIDIQMPDFETRCAIIEAKASLSGVELEKDTVEYLAQNVKTNIRELEGVLNQLLAYAEMRGVTPDTATAEGLIGNARTTRPRHITAKQIVDRTAKYFQISTTEMCSPKRDKHIVTPRQIAMYLLRSELHMSFPNIAHELGRKDHTTAIHAVEKIEKATKLDFATREHVSEIRERLYA